MARIPDIERRLLNWARVRLARDSGGIGYASTTLRERVDGDGWDSHARIPTVDHDADVTEAAIASLDVDLQRTVQEVYLRGDGIAAKARRLGVAPATVYSRIDMAHIRLAGWFSERDRAAGAERERVERLQRSAAGGLST